MSLSETEALASARASSVLGLNLSRARPGRVVDRTMLQACGCSSRDMSREKLPKKMPAKKIFVKISTTF
jgi:hypothetical protein